MMWIFSESETSHLLELNRAIREKTLAMANHKLGANLIRYSPFMCNLESLGHLQSKFQIDDFLITDRNVLSGLSKYYCLERKEAENVYPGPLEKERYKYFGEALNYVNSVPTLATMFEGLIDHIVPLNPKEGSVQALGAGSSTLLARGAIFSSVPYMKELSRIQLAVNLSHELGHQTLMIYQTANRVIKDDFSSPIYSYIKNTDRPIIMSFHASFALAFMTEFLLKVDQNLLTDAEKQFVSEELERIRSDFKDSLSEFKADHFTDFGSMLFNELVEYARAA
jgi:hypothetical protein